MATNVHPERRSVTTSDRAGAISRGAPFRGCTLWFTGLPAAGKTSVSFTVESMLCERGVPCYSLDGDNIRSGLNADLGFSPEARAENIRRVGEVAKLFADAGYVTLTSFISPYTKDRARARECHEKADLRFFECYVDTAVSVCEDRDPKGLYAKARAGQITGFTGVDAPYEAPASPELHLQAGETSVRDLAAQVLLHLHNEGILEDHHVADLRAAAVPERIVPEGQVQEAGQEAATLPQVELTTVDLQWLQVLSEGWAAPLTGFMRKHEYLQCLHFGTQAVGATSADGAGGADATSTQGSAIASARRVNQSVPIVLAIDDAAKARVAGAPKVALVHEGRVVATLDQPEVMSAGRWLIGGDVTALRRVTWGDGLDEYRLTPNELRAEFERRGADAVYAFQLRNPIHNGHALLMADTREKLLARGYRKPVLLLHPLGGWTKEDDVPLPVRMRQHKAVLEDGSLLDKDNTVLAVFPSPMMYAGPTEVQWHAKARLNAGAQFYIVGRDPAGMSHPTRLNGEGKADSLFEPTHGCEVLQMAPGLSGLEIIPFRVAAYDKTAGRMAFFEPSRAAEFDFISGTRMREIAKSGAEPPSGFMAPKAWTVLKSFYQG